MGSGIIGAGHVGSTLARLLSAVGHEVKFSNSRGAETLAELVKDLTEARARAALAGS